MFQKAEMFLSIKAWGHWIWWAAVKTKTVKVSVLQVQYTFNTGHTRAPDLENNELQFVFDSFSDHDVTNTDIT